MLLVFGLVLSQFLPSIFGSSLDPVATSIRVATMIGLAFIMIHVGFEFHIDKTRLGSYGWDYVVAFTAAFFPWVLVTGYFLLVMLPSDFWSDWDAWKETFLAGRFAAPTSAGVLFSMLAAAGLAGTWVFNKARVLAIFDDLDTVLLMIPLKMLMVGIAWQLGTVVLLFTVLLIGAYMFMHRLKLPITWQWVVVYSVLIVGVSEIVYAGSKVIDPSVPIHIEVLLPAFVLGVMARPRGGDITKSVESQIHAVLERPSEAKASFLISAVFMLLVGLSMPAILTQSDAQHAMPTSEELHSAAPPSAVDKPEYQGGKSGLDGETVTANQPSIGWGLIVLHVVAITVISNIGKMFPAFCYRAEASWRRRLALSIGMWPRGEVGAGILVLSLGFGIGGPIVTVAMLSLAANLVLSGVFIVAVKRLMDHPENEQEPATNPVAQPAIT